MCWLGSMLSKLCKRVVDDVAASKKIAVLAALEQLSLLLKRHVYFCCACFFFICLYFPVIILAGSELRRWQAMFCMAHGVWQNLGLCNFCFCVG